MASDLGGVQLVDRLQDALSIEEVLPPEANSRKGKGVDRTATATPPLLFPSPASGPAKSHPPANFSVTSLSSSSSTQTVKKKPFLRLFGKSEKHTAPTPNSGSNAVPGVLGKEELKQRKKQEAKDRRDRLAYHFQQAEHGKPLDANRSLKPRPRPDQRDRLQGLFEGLEHVT